MRASRGMGIVRPGKLPKKMRRKDKPREFDGRSKDADDKPRTPKPQ